MSIDRQKKKGRPLKFHVWWEDMHLLGLMPQLLKLRTRIIFHNQIIELKQIALLYMHKWGTHLVVKEPKLCKCPFHRG